MLDYHELIRPYSDPTVTGDPRRTPEGQRDWLVNRRHYDADLVDAVMAGVYAEIAVGRKFENGHALDRHMRDRCEELTQTGHKARIEAQTQVLTEAADLARKATRQLARPDSWVRQPVVTARWFRTQILAFVLGAGAMGAAWLLTTLFL